VTFASGTTADLFDDWRFRVLTAWCGCEQVGHIAVNAAYFLDHSPFPEPPGGWHPQAQMVFTGIGVSDSIFAAISLVFVIAYFRRRPWAFAVGLLSLGSYVASEINMTVFTARTGAFAAGPGWYLLVHLWSAPLVILCAWLVVALARAATGSAPPTAALQRRAS
jgi:hypothetical protein